MRPPRVPERVRYGPKSFDLTDLVLDPDTKPAQPLIILLFLFRQFAAFGLLVRIIDGLVFRVVALIRAVAIRPRALGQLRTRAANGEVMAAAGLRWRNAGDPAVPRHDILGFQRVALFLAGVMPLLNRIIAGPVDGLLRAVDDQSLGLFPADPGFALHPLAAQDIAGSKAHVAMLAKQGIVERSDADAIAAGLDQVKGEIEAGAFTFRF